MAFKIKAELNEDYTSKNLKKVLFLSMNKMNELATINAPFDTGRLAESIKLYPSYLGAEKFLLITSVEYAEYLEYGTRPHIIRIKNKKVLASKKAIFGKEVKHPGTEAQPFMRPALDQVKLVWVKRYMNQVFMK